MVSDALKFELPAIRPPSESSSLLIRVTRNCPWNRCTFCYGMLYHRAKFVLRPVEDVKQDILALKNLTDEIINWAGSNGFSDRLGQVARANGIFWIHDDGVRTAFLGDSNSLIVNTDQLTDIISFLYSTFDQLERVTSYARAKTVLKKTPEDLSRLEKAGLSRLHVGLETGDDKLLHSIDKGVTSQEIIRAGRMVVDSGISLSLYVMPGLGGRARWRQHAEATAMVLNAINPDFIRLRTLVLKPGTPLYTSAKTGKFDLSTAEDVLAEERLLIEKLDVTSQLLSDHVSNYLPVNGKLPEDKPKMLNKIDEVLALSAAERELRLQPEARRTL